MGIELRCEIVGNGIDVIVEEEKFGCGVPVSCRVRESSGMPLDGLHYKAGIGGSAIESRREILWNQVRWGGVVGSVEELGNGWWEVLREADDGVSAFSLLQSALVWAVSALALTFLQPTAEVLIVRY